MGKEKTEFQVVISDKATDRDIRNLVEKGRALNNISTGIVMPSDFESIEIKTRRNERRRTLNSQDLQSVLRDRQR